MKVGASIRERAVSLGLADRLPPPVDDVAPVGNVVPPVVNVAPTVGDDVPLVNEGNNRLVLYEEIPDLEGAGDASTAPAQWVGDDVPPVNEGNNELVLYEEIPDLEGAGDASTATAQWLAIHQAFQYFAKLYNWLLFKFTTGPGDKWVTRKEIAKFSPTICSSTISLLSMRYPDEKNEVQATRGWIICVLAWLYGGFYFVKVREEYKEDNASIFHYKATIGNRRIFYKKSIVHVIGIIVLLISVCSGLYTCFYKDPWVSYKLSLASGLSTLIHAALQGLKFDNTPSLLVPGVVEDRRWAVPLLKCANIPPIGEYAVYQYDDNAEAFPLED